MLQVLDHKQGLFYNYECWPYEITFFPITLSLFACAVDFGVKSIVGRDIDFAV